MSQDHQLLRLHSSAEMCKEGTRKTSDAPTDSSNNEIAPSQFFCPEEQKTHALNLPLSVSTIELASVEKSSKTASQEASPVSPKKKMGLSEFGLLELVGMGAYSKVALVEQIATGRKFAMKVMEKKFLLKEGKVVQAKLEKEIWSELNHPLIVKLHYSFTDEAHIYFVMDYACHGSLQEYLDREPRLPKKLVQFYAAEIALMLEYLHTKAIAHRDLKPQNLLLDEKYHLKLCDFGSAKRCVEGQSKARRGTFVGTKNYVAPEVILTQMSGTSADLWSYGCVIYQLLAGKPPFNEEMGVAFEQILRGEYDFPPDFPEEAKDLCLRLMRLEKDKRLGTGPDGFEKLKAHKFFKGVNFETILQDTPPMECFENPRINSRSVLEEEINYAILDPKVKFEVEPDYFGNGKVANSKKGAVLKEEIIKKKCGWVFYKDRKLVLTDHSKLIYYTPENVFKGEIILSNLVTVKKNGAKGFNIEIPGRTYKFQTRTEASAKEWVACINSTILSKEEKKKHLLDKLS